MEAQDLLLQRRSVYPRQFNGNIIPKSALETAFLAANWAPTHKRTQPWRFIVYSGKSMNELIDQWISMAKANLEAKGETWTEVSQAKFELMRKSSHIIAMACHYTGLVPEIEETCAAAAAIQNFWLSLHNQGYVGYWSTGNGIFTETMHEYLELEPNEKALGYFLAGITEGPVPPSIRKPVDEFIRWKE
ncbi:MAG: nitroreductase family protein [Bacteroidota bacterium]|nr:nitroreductase family protein [Bacteroidota bacterium]MDX5430260.1 nitroreductase family protein [Bacteroidota bacterium]MDX5469021.1 nitroreductase family protein [Bacteroidota bacterium]